MNAFELIENPVIRNREGVFEGREEAGEMLADWLKPITMRDAIVLAIPSGGVPIGRIIADRLKLEMDLCIVRKAQLPWNTEAGFGAVNLDGYVILNPPLVNSLHLSQEAIDQQVAKTRGILGRRDQLFRHGRPFPSLEGRTAFLVDDGLASGFTMLAAIAYLRRRSPERIVIAVPTGCLDTISRLSDQVSTILCLNVRDFYPFAVAAAYRTWYDLEDADVLRIMRGL